MTRVHDRGAKAAPAVPPTGTNGSTPLRASPHGMSSAARRMDCNEPEVPVDEVFRLHAPFVCRVLRHLGVEAGQLDDATQDVFVIVHRRFESYDARSSLRGWLYGICRRVASHVRRSRSRALTEAQGDVAAVDRRTPEAWLNTKRDVEFVQTFMARLSERKRVVFLMADVEGMTAPEIAETLAIPVATVYTRLRDARLAFQRAVAKRAPKTKVDHDAGSR